MSNTGMLIIISGPSGSGKGTVVRQLTDTNDKYALSISMTTRQRREFEIDGKDYFFCNEKDFILRRDNNELLEHAVFCGNLYGTPKYYVEEQIKEGKAVILEIDVNGALQVKEKFKDAVLIFLIPPTLEELYFRLVGRNTENEEVIQDRLRKARDEINLLDKYDYLVINDEVLKAVEKINYIINAEYLKPHRNKVFIENLKGVEVNA